MKKIVLSLLIIALPVQAEWFSSFLSSINDHKTLIAGGFFTGLGLGGIGFFGIKDGYWKSKPDTDTRVIINRLQPYSVPASGSNEQIGLFASPGSIVRTQGRIYRSNNHQIKFFDQDECKKRNTMLIGSGVSLATGICLFGLQVLKK